MCLRRVLLALTTIVLVLIFFSAVTAARDVTKTDVSKTAEKKQDDPIYDIGGDVKPPSWSTWWSQNSARTRSRHSSAAW